MEIIATIKEDFTFATKDLKDTELKEVTVKIVRFNNTVQFQMELPDYILKAAQEQFPDKYGKLTKIQRFTHLQHLKDSINGISYELEKKNTFEEKLGQKVLFIKFVGEEHTNRHGYCHAGMGQEIVLVYNFFVGYRLIYQKKKWLTKEDEYETVKVYKSMYSPTKYGMGRESRLGEYVPLHHTQNDIAALEREYLIVDWTQEREDYLLALEQAFRDQMKRVAEFLKDLDREKLDHLISQFSAQKLLTL